MCLVSIIVPANRFSERNCLTLHEVCTKSLQDGSVMDLGSEVVYQDLSRQHSLTLISTLGLNRLAKSVTC